jgi:nitrogen PTS system EIIA component
VRITDKLDFLHDLSTRTATALGIDVAAVSGAPINREELGSTGMGAGVALPHARLVEVKQPFGVPARLRKKIDFAAIDGEPVDLAFLLLLPATTGGDQLNALAAVARKLRNGKVAAELRHARDAQEMHRAFADQPGVRSRERTERAAAG